MGKTQSKQITEEIIIAQNGAGNNAGASTTNKDFNKTGIERIELYTIIVLFTLLIMISYSVWRYCKVRFGRYMRRELQEGVVVMRNGDRDQGARQIIV